MHQTLLLLLGIVCASGCGLLGVKLGNCTVDKIYRCNQINSKAIQNCPPTHSEPGYLIPTVNANCCLSCIPPNCTLKSSNSRVTPLARITLSPKLTWTCNVPIDSIPPCSLNLSQSIMSGCPSCRKMETPCNAVCPYPYTGIHTCAQNEIAVKNTINCCPSCVPANSIFNCQNSSILCNSGTLAPYCSLEKSSHINTKSCCAIDCRCQPNNNPRICPDFQFKSCISNTPVCDDNALPCYLKESCCPSCKKRVWEFRAEEYSACLSTRRSCNINETPIWLYGDNCPLCAVRKPKCNRSCSSNEMCVYLWRSDGTIDTSVKPLCNTKKNIDLEVLNTTDHTRISAILALSEEGRLRMVQDIVEKFCDKQENVLKCNQYSQAFKNMEGQMIETKFLRVCVPDYGTLENSTSFVTSALLSPSATGNVTISIAGQNNASRSSSLFTRSILEYIVVFIGLMFFL